MPRSKANCRHNVCQTGKTKDYRSHLKQMMHRHGSGWPAGMLGNVIAQHRRCDHAAPVIDRRRQRFLIGRVCVVADCGMISAEVIVDREEFGARPFANV
jgi:hypothetical protein